MSHGRSVRCEVNNQCEAKVNSGGQNDDDADT